MFRKLRTLISLTALALSAALPAQAQNLGDILEAELLPGWRTESGAHMAAIRLTLASGWKTYWRSPGDAGIPPEISWTGSENLRGVKLLWPTPEVFHFNGMQSIGYSREVVLPIEIFPRDAARPVHLETALDLGVCRDICVPARVHLASTLSGAGRPDPAIRRALGAQPVNARAIGLSTTRCRLEPTSRGMKLSVELTMPPMGADEVVVIETSEGNTWVSEARSQRQGKVLRAEADIASLDGRPLSFDRSTLRVTVLAGGKAAEAQGCQGG